MWRLELIRRSQRPRFPQSPGSDAFRESYRGGRRSPGNMIVHCLVRILGPLVRHSSQVPTLISIPLGLLQRSVRGTKAPSNYVVRSRPKPSFLVRAPDDKLPIAAEDSVGRRDKMSRITNLV